jgi:hypothetical protein
VGNALDVEQRAGASTWHVAADRQLRIATGATGASVEATGASLRVEVQMNKADSRVIGASALTAAVAAMTTVVVYEGHVKVTSAGQSLVVPAGSTIDVRSGQPPTPAPTEPTIPAPLPPLVPAVGADVAIRAGESVTIQDFAPSTRVQIVSDCNGKRQINFSADPPDEMLEDGAMFPPGHHRYMLRCAGSEEPLTGTIDIGRGMREGDDVATINEPRVGDAWASPLHIVGTTIPDAKVSIDGKGVMVDDGSYNFDGQLDLDNRSSLAIRVDTREHGIHIYVRRPPGTQREATVDCSSVLLKGNDLRCVKQYCATHEADDVHCPSRRCDADRLRNEGSQAEGVSQHALALAKFEESFRCKPDPRTVPMAFMAACNMSNVPKAKLYWQKLSPDQQNRFVQICERNRIDRRQLDAP